jgi:hypothetical protein
VRATKFGDIGIAIFAAVKRKALAHDLDRLGLTGEKRLRAVNRMPKPAHESSRESARPSRHKLIVMQLPATAFWFHKIALDASRHP